MWTPPTEARAAERSSVWFELEAGDAVIMDHVLWHRGGANTSEQRRTLLAVSFVAADASRSDTITDEDARRERKPRLDELVS